jgi:hypothetical protein
MEDFEEKEFTWSGLFAVTACCSFIFNVLIKLMDGSFSELLFIIGGIAAGLAAINWFGRLIIKQGSKKRKKRRFAS